MLRNGLGAESIVWTLMFVLMPLACVYYPVAVLPDWLQIVAWTLPPTYVFEGMRALLIDHVFRADLMVAALAINAVLFGCVIRAFLALLNSARRHGSLLQTRRISRVIPWIIGRFGVVRHVEYRSVH